ncbi:MAG: PKD repeat protein [Patiriisocius sp.]|jgi:PKD repeat protein
MKKIILSTIAITLCLSFSAQSWVELRNQNKSFFEIQDAFEAEWANKEYEKGHGYKQFKRWEYWMEPRVDENGFLPPSTHIWEEYQKLRKTKFVNPDKNGEWTFSGPLSINPGGQGEGIGRINVIAVDPNNSSVIYIGAPGGGLWKSEDNGNSWAPKTDDLPTIGVTGIAIDPNNSDIIYIGTGDGDASDTYSIGVLKSLDGGDTWINTGLIYDVEGQRNVHKLSMDPNDSQTLYCATGTSLAKTVNGGDSWYTVRSGEVYDFEFHPTNPDIMYLCTPSLYRSTNGGESFQSIVDGVPSAFQMSRSCLAVSEDEPDWVYFLAGGTDYGLLGVYRSTNSGENFSQRADESPNLMGWSETGNGSGGQAWYDIALTVDPENANRIFVGGVNLWGSTNGGSNWGLRAHWIASNPSSYVHADIHFLHYFAGTFYCGSDGGIFKSTNDGSSWSSISDGLGITQIYGIGTTDQNPSKMTLGAQDNGSSLRNSTTWTKVFGGDGMQTQISPTNQNRIYVSYQNGNLYLSNDGGNNFDSYSGNIDESGAWLTPYELRPDNGNIVIAGFENIWEYNSGWTQLSDFNFSTINHIALTAADDDYIYFANGEQLYMTSDHGDSWSNIDEGIPSIAISGIAVDDANPEIVYVSISGYNEGIKVYKSVDGGLNWENYSSNLPNVPANCLALGENGALYVGTDLGVFYTDDELSNWQNFSDGMPMVQVSDIDLLPNSGIVRAATYGRGIWDSPLYSPLTTEPEVDFESDLQVICEGQSISFTDNSFNANIGWNWTFDGGTPSTSSDPNPLVTYDTAGTYEVTLSMSNNFGDDIEVKEAYITVTDGAGFSVPFVESFADYTSFPSDAWFTDNEDNNVTWELSTEVGASDNSSMFLDNNLGNEDDLDELVSQVFDLTGGVGSVLTYKYAHAQNTDDNNGKMKVYFSSNCGESWQIQGSNSANGNLSTAEPTSEFFIPTSDQWDEDSELIDEQYLGPDFKFKFQHKNDNGNVLYVDDINIEGFVGIGELFEGKNGVNIFPNPSNNFITVRFEQDGESVIIIRNLLGEVVTKLSLNSGYGNQDYRFDVKDFASGIYNLEIHQGDGAAVRASKFMVK